MRQIIDPRLGFITIPDIIEVEDYTIDDDSGIILVDRTLKAYYRIFQDNEVISGDEATPAIGDMVFDLWSGPVLIDRVTGVMRRLFLDNEETKWEVVRQPRRKDIVWGSNVGFVFTDVTLTPRKWRVYISNGAQLGEEVI